MAGKKKSKIYIYFVCQYKNNPKDNKEFVNQYNKCIFLLGFDLSKMDSEQKSNRKLSDHLSIIFL